MSVPRHCARPGCAGAVTAWLSYDYAGQRAWLDDPGVEIGGHHSALCAAHAGRLRVPQGWSCQDRRISRLVPALQSSLESPTWHQATSEPTCAAGVQPHDVPQPVTAATTPVPGRPPVGHDDPPGEGRPSGAGGQHGTGLASVAV